MMTEQRRPYITGRESTEDEQCIIPPRALTATEAAMQRRAANKDSLTVSTFCERCHTTPLYGHDLRASRFPRYCAPCSDEMLTWLASASTSTTAR